ncbi:AfsR/SARP family transcriptional regulator [Sphaerisporangium flaviroseum]|uniref:AfsR/SARP family transcriptional regulator n=1 Tax=Sphaerisporangium flaviroseum TaxID=509199 RepID=UPI0031EDF608
MRAVLATLLLHPGQTVTLGQFARGAWVDPPRAVASNVRTYITQLRSAFAMAGEEASRLATRPEGYSLVVHAGELDLRVFEALVDEADGAVPDAPGRAADRLREAMRLWRGEPLAGLAVGPLLQDEVTRLAERRITVTERWADLALQAGRHDEVADETARQVRLHPLRERLWELLMLALYRSGRQGDALAAYQEAYEVLKEELGVAPRGSLQRLQRQMLAADPALDGPSVAPKSVPAGRRPTRPRQLPPDVPAFTGRAKEIARLDAAALGGGDGSPAIVIVSAIEGTAGVGKTTLAVHWARRIAHRFGDGQLYVNLRGFVPEGEVMSTAEALRGFLDGLGVPPDRVPAGLDAQIGLYRSLLAERRVLVILDNARDARQVRPLLPGAPGCAAVVTSRNRLSGLVAAEGAQPLTLDLLSRMEARELLTRRLGAARVAAESVAADQIIDLCARLPLALAIAAARAITHPELPLAVLAAELRDARGGLDAFAGEDPATDVRAVLSWSYRALSPDAARLFRLLGLHPGPDLAAPAAASLTGDPGRPVRPLLEELTGAHLLTEHRPGRYTFHDLLRGYAAELAELHDTEEERRAARHRLLDHYLHTAYTATMLLEPHAFRPITLTPIRPGAATVPLAGPSEAAGWFTGERQVLLAAVGRASSAGFTTHCWQLAWTLTEFLDRGGHWHEWVASQETALAAAERAGDRTGLLYTCQALVRAYGTLNRPEDAASHMERLRELHADATDVKGPAQHHLRESWIHHLEGRHQRALEESSRALALYQAAGDLYGEAACLNAVGYYLIPYGRAEEGLKCCQEALRIQRDIGDRRGEGATLDSIGLAYRHLGRLAAAKEAYQRCLDVQTELGHRYYQAHALVRIGEIHLDSGTPEAARDAWTAALAILDDLSHPEADAVRAKLHRLGH